MNWRRSAAFFAVFWIIVAGLALCLAYLCGGCFEEGTLPGYSEQSLEPTCGTCVVLIGPDCRSVSDRDDERECPVKWFEREVRMCVAPDACPTWIRTREVLR